MDKAKAIEVLKPLVNSYVDYANITMKEEDDDIAEALEMAIEALKQPEYEAVKVEDFAKTMSENTIYSFKAWHSMALAELMEKQGFVICKKTM